MKKVEASILIQTTPDQLMAAFLDPKMLRDWWGVERSLIQLQPGGLYSLAWNISEQGFGYVSSGIIKSYVPNRQLVIEKFAYFNPEKSILGPMSLTIEARELEKGAELYICQDGYQNGGDWDWYYQAVVEAWPKVVVIIRDYLEAL